VAGGKKVTGAAEAVIDVQGIGVTYRSRVGMVRALDDINLQARQGEFVALVGPSGCGKSTLLKVVAGLLRPTEGIVRLDGSRVEGPASHVGVVFQTPLLMSWRTVMENILLQMEIRRQDPRRFRQAAQDLVDLVGISGFEESYPHQLSGGMQQRVALCRALIHDPALLLMDEPFGALDALTREQMNLELQRIWMGKKKTVLFITHSIPEAVFLADQVIVMSRRPGRIIHRMPIHLPRPRTLENMGKPEFARLTEEVRGQLQASGALD